MPDLLAFLLRLLASPFRSTIDLEVEVLALRQQLAIYQRSALRPRLRLRDRLFWCWLARLWSGWKQAPQSAAFDRAARDRRSVPRAGRTAQQWEKAASAARAPDAREVALLDDCLHP